MELFNSLKSAEITAQFNEVCCFLQDELSGNNEFNYQGDNHYCIGNLGRLNC